MFKTYVDNNKHSGRPSISITPKDFISLWNAKNCRQTTDDISNIVGYCITRVCKFYHKDCYKVCAMSAKRWKEIA